MKIYLILILCFVTYEARANWKFSVGVQHNFYEDNAENLSMFNSFYWGNFTDHAKTDSSSPGLNFSIIKDWRDWSLRLAGARTKVEGDPQPLIYNFDGSTSLNSHNELTHTLIALDLYYRIPISSRALIFLGAGIFNNATTLKQNLDYGGLSANIDVEAKGSTLSTRYFAGIHYFIRRDFALSLEVGKQNGTIEEFELQNGFTTPGNWPQAAGEPFRTDNGSTTEGEKITYDLSSVYTSLSLIIDF